MKLREPENNVFHILQHDFELLTAKYVLDAFISFRIRKVAEIQNAAKFGVRNHLVSCPLLTPLTFLLSRSAKHSRLNGVTGLVSGRLGVYGTHGHPEFTLRDLPRITVRGQTVQGAGLALRTALLRSSEKPLEHRTHL